MKKIEILKLIEAKQIIKNNSTILSITRDKIYESILIDKKYWFPQIDELNEEFAILGEEVQSILTETTNCKKYIQSSNCEHEIRLKYYNLFGHYSKCIFCGKTAESDNCVSWESSINRNKYCVKLDAKEQKDDYDDYISNGYTEEEIIDIIINILKKYDDFDEVDLVQEFKKLNLKNCTINEEKKVNENYILIISGTNKQYIDSESYLFKEGLNQGIDFMKYFSGLLNTKVELIDNQETTKNDDFFKQRNYNLKLIHYITISDLKKILNEQKNIPFKLIIDLSEPYEYHFTEESVKKEPIDLNLSEIFPNSRIIRIKNLSKKSLEELSTFLKTNQDYNSLYAYQNNAYHYLEDNKVTSDNLENTCSKIKKILRK